MRAQQIAKLKADYVKYFEDVPVQKYAAMSIGRDEDTIVRWKQGDPDFADAIQVAKAKWIRKKVLATKAEFALERLEKEVFSPRNIDERDYSNALVIYKPERLPSIEP